MFGDPRLQEDLERLLRQYEGRIADLERKSLDDVPVGTVITFQGKARSESFSKTYDEARNGLDDHYYLMNDRFGPVDFITNQIGGSSLLSRHVAVGGGVTFDQPGGLASEGSSSVYFPGNGSNYSAIQPLFAAGDTSWTMEVLVKPKAVKDQMPIYVGDTVAANGYAIYLDVSGNIRIYMRGIVSQDTGFDYVANEWYHLIMSRVGSSMYLSSNGSEYSFNPASFNASLTQKLTIGADSGAGNGFNGWIDRASIMVPTVPYNPGVKTKYTGYDRYQAAMVPRPPAGWVACDATLVSKSEYARLWSVLKYTQPAIMHTATHFNLPNVTNGLIKV